MGDCPAQCRAEGRRASTPAPRLCSSGCHGLDIRAPSACGDRLGFSEGVRCHGQAERDCDDSLRAAFLAAAGASPGCGPGNSSRRRASAPAATIRSLNSRKTGRCQDRRNSAEHGRATDCFASAEHRDAFAAEPERCLPQYGGYCADAAAKGSLRPNRHGDVLDRRRQAFSQLQPGYPPALTGRCPRPYRRGPELAADRGGVASGEFLLPWMPCARI